MIPSSPPNDGDGKYHDIDLHKSHFCKLPGFLLLFHFSLPFLFVSFIFSSNPLHLLSPLSWAILATLLSLSLSLSFLYSLPSSNMDTTLSKTSVSSKTEISSSNFETDIDHVHIDSKFRMFQLAENLRLGLSVLAFAAAITVMGISAHAVAVYDATHLPEDFLLPLWPAKFDLRPNEAMVAGSVVVIVANAVSLVVNKIKPVSDPQGQPTPKPVAIFPFLSFFFMESGKTNASCPVQRSATTPSPI